MICCQKWPISINLCSRSYFGKTVPEEHLRTTWRSELGAGRLGRTCSGWILDRSVVGWGAPPVVTQKTAANPGQSWQASNPLEILGVWLVERTSLLGKRQNAQPVGKSFTLTKWEFWKCVFSFHICSNFERSSADQKPRKRSSAT